MIHLINAKPASAITIQNLQLFLLFSPLFGLLRMHEEEEEGRDGGDSQPGDVDGACWKLREGERSLFQKQQRVNCV